MPTTGRDAQALAYLACRLRAETHGCREWDNTGTFAVIKAELVGKNLGYALEQILCHGTDPEAKTPGAIKRNFTPPKPSERPSEPAHPPRSNEVCRTHPAQRAESCPWCVHGVKSWDEAEEPEPPDLPPTPPTLAARLARGIGPRKTEIARIEEGA